MAGGPLHWYSAAPSTAEVFPWIYTLGGAVSPAESMLGLLGSQTADAIWHLAFEAPQSLPTGTAKLRLISRANVATGTVVVEPQWKSVAMGEEPHTGALNAEGDTTITWTTGDENDYKETIITLDADTIVADEIIRMDLKFDVTATLTVDSGHLASIIWE